MTLSVFFLLLALIVLAWFVVILAWHYAEEHEKRLERIIQSLQISDMSAVSNRQYHLMELLWMVRRMIDKKPIDEDVSPTPAEPEKPSEEVAVADEPYPECCDGVKVDETMSVEESA